MHTTENLLTALCAALDTTTEQVEAVDDIVAYAQLRRQALNEVAASDARGTIEWQRRRVAEAIALLGDIGTAPIAPGSPGIASADGELMAEAEVVALLQYPVRWVRYGDRFTRSGKGKTALYQRSQVLAYKQERDASGWLTLEEAEARLSFPYLHPFQCASRIPAVKLRGQLRFSRLEAERERPARVAAWREKEALGPEGRRAYDEKIRAQVDHAIKKWRLRSGTTKGSRRG